MLTSIIRKTLLSNLLSYKFSIITILSTLLILLSIFIMYGDYLLAMDNDDILRRDSGKESGIVRPTPLGIFAKGLDDNLCRPWELEAVGVKISSEKQKSLNDLFKLFTAPDLLYVIKVILSLCAMLFAFDIVCGEKETGTLRQSLSSSLRRSTLIAGEWIGGFASLIVPFFIAVLLATLFVTLQPRVAVSPQDWAKFGLFLLCSVVYLAVFFSLGLLISCLTRESSSSLVVSLFAWTILVFLIPNLGTILARQFIQIPTAQQLDLQRRQIMNRALFEMKRIPTNQADSGARRTEIQFRTMKEGDQLDADYRNRITRLVNVCQNITGLSPAATFTLLATDIMGTGVAEERRLKEAAKDYKDLLIQMYTDGTLTEESKAPQFHHQRSSVKEILAAGGLRNCLLLIVFNLLFFIAAYVSFLQYDVR
jgi:ABC-type transport system involved in multi-copper enzyme maturation permease subunit